MVSQIRREKHKQEEKKISNSDLLKILSIHSSKRHPESEKATHGTEENICKLFF